LGRLIMGSTKVLRERLQAVEERIARAADRAGRKREEITLIAVTKLFPARVIRETYALGLRHFGENYVQEFETKFPEVSDLEGAEFHLIGHLQSNKAKRAAELFQVIETIDSAKLARRLEGAGKTLEVMLEVRLSEEASKSGAEPAEVAGLIAAVQDCGHLRLTGLMTMPPWSEDAEQSRPFFQRLRQLAEEYGLPHLSMGMSHDLEVAIEEGATHIRIGTALFGPRKEA
jgi:pyridoxal phosphate enzyme (YggS family)